MSQQPSPDAKRASSTSQTQAVAAITTRYSAVDSISYHMTSGTKQYAVVATTGRPATYMMAALQGDTWGVHGVCL